VTTACGAIVFAASCTSFSSTACSGMVAMSDQAHSVHNATIFNVAPFFAHPASGALLRTCIERASCIVHCALQKCPTVCTGSLPCNRTWSTMQCGG
jgi:hypothetical protein